MTAAFLACLLPFHRLSQETSESSTIRDFELELVLVGAKETFTGEYEGSAFIIHW